jgi:hypothetical protein
MAVPPGSEPRSYTVARKTFSEDVHGEFFMISDFAREV